MNVVRIVLVAIFVAASAAASWCQAQQRYAFVVGVEDYSKEFFRRLDYAEDDAIELSRRLESLGYHVMRMTGEEDDSDYKPTDPQTILKALDGRLKGIEAEDTLLVALSGHGVQFTDEPKMPDGSRETYFCPEKARLDTKSTLLPISRELLSRIRACPARRKLVLLDACRNEVLSPVGDKSSTRIKLDSVHENFRTIPRGMTVLFSCSSREKSWEHKQLEHSVFSNYVLKYLAGEATSSLYDRGQPDIDGLVTYVRRNTNQFVLDNITSSGQLPELIGDRESWHIGPAPAEVVAKSITNSIGMKLNLIPAGEFLMGSTESEKDRSENEQQHRVRITQPFYMATTEVTQGQWEAVMGTTPWKGESLVKEGSDYAASYISWNDAFQYCRRLSAKDGRSYRLPTEAEWEYACRAKSTSVYSFGDSPGSLKDYAWFRENASDVGDTYAHQVEQKRPNAFGLYDMHGNVWEWCSDWYGVAYYAESPSSDPTGPMTGSIRVLRGGSWYDDPQSCRSAIRGWFTPASQDRHLGFRVSSSVLAEPSK